MRLTFVLAVGTLSILRMRSKFVVVVAESDYQLILEVLIGHIRLLFKTLSSKVVCQPLNLNI